ncbi:hypothetical protein ACWGHM_31730 [Streptomyces sp. NPDC054904]|uniref:hypothetical protein n=1 Tax=Streptomyces sp. NPDC090054 TaxID=3365933 RepID=UPI0037F472FA
MGVRIRIAATIGATAAVAVPVTGVQVPAMLADRDRETALERLRVAERAYQESGRASFGAQLDPPEMPPTSPSTCSAAGRNGSAPARPVRGWGPARRSPSVRPA